MEFFKIRRDIPFMENALVFNIISFLTFAAAVFFLVTRGLHLSVEFTGGTVMEVGYSQAADVERVRRTVSNLGFADVQADGEALSIGVSGDASSTPILVKRLVDAGAEIVSVAAEEPPLEDEYVRLLREP